MQSALATTNLPGYWHALEGRLRVYTPEVKRAPQRALFVELLLRSLDGVFEVKANPTTGNVLVHFAPESLTHQDIILVLKKADCLRAQEFPFIEPTHRRLSALLRDAVIRSLSDALVQRALAAIF